MSNVSLNNKEKTDRMSCSRVPDNMTVMSHIILDKQVEVLA